MPAAARAYVKGRSCPSRGLAHQYAPVAGRLYERCAACGSTRTVKGAGAAPSLPGPVTLPDDPRRVGEPLAADAGAPAKGCGASFECAYRPPGPGAELEAFYAKCGETELDGAVAYCPKCGGRPA